METLTAKALLSLKEPESLFPNDADLAQVKFHDLMKIWHPDTSHDVDAVAVAGHIGVLYKAVKDKIADGTWTLPNTYSFSCKDGKKRVLRYLRKRSFELGEVAYGRTIICFVIRPENADLADNFLRVVSRLAFLNDSMRDEIAKYLPSVHEQFTAKDGTRVIVLNKTEDVYLMHDVMDHFGGTIGPRHVAWMLSSLYNLMCYLAWSHVTLNALSPDTLFMSPQKHTCLLYGAGWYATEEDCDLIAVPRRTVEVIPSITKSNKRNPKTELTLVRVLGRELLGDISGMSLDPKVIPPAMLAFLRASASDRAMQDYKFWKEVTLVEAFGPRKFEKMDITSDLIYKG